MCCHRFARDCGIEPGCGLVHEQQRRLVDQPEGDVEAAPLPARERAARTFPRALEVELREAAPGHVLGRRPRQPVEPPLVDQLFANERLRGRAASLRDVADAPAHRDRRAPEIVPGDHGRARESG